METIHERCGQFTDKPVLLNWPGEASRIFINLYNYTLHQALYTMQLFTYSAFICASFWSGKRLDFRQSGLIILCILLVRRTNKPNQLLVFLSLLFLKNICCAIIRVKTWGLEVLDGVEKVLVGTWVGMDYLLPQHVIADTAGISSPKNTLSPLWLQPNTL